MHPKKLENNRPQEPKISPNIEGWDMLLCTCLLALTVCIYPKEAIIGSKPLITELRATPTLMQKLEKLKLQIPKSF